MGWVDICGINPVTFFDFIAIFKQKERSALLQSFLMFQLTAFHALVSLTEITQRWLSAGDCILSWEHSIVVRSWKIEFIILSIKKYVVLFSQISIINSSTFNSQTNPIVTGSHPSEAKSSEINDETKRSDMFLKLKHEVKTSSCVIHQTASRTPTLLTKQKLFSFSESWDLKVKYVCSTIYYNNNKSAQVKESSKTWGRLGG